MKRRLVWSGLALILALVLGMAAASGEAAGQRTGLMELIEVNGESPTWLGTGVPVYDGVLLTAASVLPDGMNHLVVSDGVHTWDAEVAVPDQNKLLATVIYDTTQQAPEMAPVSMTSLRGVPDISDLSVLFGDENGSRIKRSVDSLVLITWQSAPCLLASLSGPAENGAVMVTSEGSLVGIAVAKWAEGNNRVVFMTDEAMVQSIAESLDRMMGTETANPPEGFTVKAEGNVVYFDWSGMVLPETGEGEKLYLVISDVMNTYLTYLPIGNGTAFAMILTPGRTYQAGIAAYADIPSAVPEACASITLLPAEKLTEYGFTSRVCAIAEAPEGGLKSGELPTPVEKVTEELLRSDRAYFYSSTAYEVTETISDIPLLITLTDPEGNNYRYESSWTYDPSYMNDDTWAVSLKTAGLVDMLNDSGYPEGTYQVDMYIGNALADSFTFDLP